LRERIACQVLYDKTAMTLSKRLIFRLVLTALLLFSQQVTVGHFGEHALDHGPIQAHAGGEDKGFQSKLCAYHGAFEALQSAVGSASLELLVADNAFEERSGTLNSLSPTQSVVPASRGPPIAALLS
jgi:hypothetical protein